MSNPALTTPLNAREVKMMSAYLSSIVKAPEVDWDKFASLTEYGGAKSARDNFNKLKTKIGNLDDQAPESPIKAKQEAKMPGSKKGQKRAPADSNGGTGARKNQQNKKVKVEQDVEAGDGDD